MIELIELRIKTEDPLIAEMYIGHSHYNSGDGGIDLFFPEDVLVKAGENMLIDLKIKCEMLETTVIEGFSAVYSGSGWYEDSRITKNVSYYMIPRSSISKTPLILHNSIGLIDSKYRNTIKAPVVNFSKTEDFLIKKGTRLFQICHPNLISINVKVLNQNESLSMDGSNRNEGGFGSTGL